jgi:hypothetical protein
MAKEGERARLGRLFCCNSRCQLYTLRNDKARPRLKSRVRDLTRVLVAGVTGRNGILHTIVAFRKYVYQ